jgi:16S rRNA processing protein RimM
LPFTKAAVPVVDVPGGRVVVDPPSTIDARPDDKGDDKGGEND